MNRDDGSGGYLVIKQGKKFKKFHLYVRSSGEAPNQGEANGVFKIIGDTAKFRVKEPSCSLDFKMKKNAIFVKTDHTKTFDCGFSNGVIADGKYVRIK